MKTPTEVTESKDRELRKELIAEARYEAEKHINGWNQLIRHGWMTLLFLCIIAAASAYVGIAWVVVLSVASFVLVTYLMFDCYRLRAYWVGVLARALGLEEKR